MNSPRLLVVLVALIVMANSAGSQGFLGSFSGLMWAKAISNSVHNPCKYGYMGILGRCILINDDSKYRINFFLNPSRLIKNTTSIITIEKHIHHGFNLVYEPFYIIRDGIPYKQLLFTFIYF